MPEGRKLQWLKQRRGRTPEAWRVCWGFQWFSESLRETMDGFGVRDPVDSEHWKMATHSLEGFTFLEGRGRALN